MDSFIVPFIFLLGVIFLARTINEKANRKLDENKKAELIDLFSKDRIYYLGIIILVVCSFILNTKYNFIDPYLGGIGYVIIVFISLIISGYLSYKKLKRNNFPGNYIRAFLLSISLRFIGLLIFFMMISF